MRNEITRLHKVLGTTFIYVTHDQIEAMTMGTKIVVMKQGVVQQVDSPMNLYDYPANEVVAGFIGTPQMNFIPGTIIYNKKDNSIKLSLDNGDIIVDYDDLRKINKRDILKEKEIILGIRPEHINLCKKNDKNACAYVINSIELLGNECNIFVDSVEGHLSLVVKTLRNDELKVGDTIYLSFNISKFHIFDKESEHSLMPRLPMNSFVQGQIKSKKLNVLGKDFALSEEIYESIKDHKNVYVNIPNSAIKEGKGVVLEIIKKEKINDEWLFIGKCEQDYIYFTNEKYIDGDKIEVSLDLSKLDLYDEELSIVLNAVKEENIVSGKLIPQNKKLPVLKGELVQTETLKRIEENNFLDEKGKKIKISYKNKRVFKYSIFDQEIEPNDDAIIKIYSLLGKKFALHTIKFVINAQDISIVNDGGVEAKIEKVLHYLDKTYYEVKVQDEKLIMLANENNHVVNDVIHIDINRDKIGVYDENFGVKLI